MPNLKHVRLRRCNSFASMRRYVWFAYIWPLLLEYEVNHKP